MEREGGRVRGIERERSRHRVRGQGEKGGRVRRGIERE